jgi:hypothetical protein
MGLAKAKINPKVISTWAGKSSPVKKCVAPPGLRSSTCFSLCGRGGGQSGQTCQVCQGPELHRDPSTPTLALPVAGARESLCTRSKVGAAVEVYANAPPHPPACVSLSPKRTKPRLAPRPPSHAEWGTTPLWLPLAFKAAQGGGAGGAEVGAPTVALPLPLPLN